jgi:hypothetical protein
MKLKPYRHKRKRSHVSRVERCGVCGRITENVPANERVNNRKYKVLQNAEKEYGKEE